MKAFYALAAGIIIALVMCATVRSEVAPEVFAEAYDKSTYIIVSMSNEHQTWQICGIDFVGIADEVLLHVDYEDCPSANNLNGMLQAGVSDGKWMVLNMNREGCKKPPVET